MTYTLAKVSLPSLSAADSLRLQPFSGAIESILFPKARRAGFRRAGRKSLSRLNRTIEIFLSEAVGHEIDQAITVFGLRRACQFYIAAIEKQTSGSLRRGQIHLLDCVWRLIVELQQHLELTETLLLVTSI